MFFRKKKADGPIDYIIVGLGNPGSKYEKTRHNAGFMALKAVADKLGVKVDRVRFKGYTATAEIGDVRVLLLMPQTFMNASGESVREAMQFYKVPAERTVVLFDDISLPVGGVRVRRKGSDGGQRGMQNIIQLCGDSNFPRVKLGIGAKPHPDYDLAAWVLSRFTSDEYKSMCDAAERAAEAACLIVQDKIDQAMNLYSK